MRTFGKGEFFIGISGWANGYFRGILYPENLPSREYLTHYARYFHTVEVNSTFYRFSRKSTFQKWHDQTPENFTFSVKAPRYFTHDNRLEDPDHRMSEFIESLEGFANKLGPILFQLPPSQKLDQKKLKAFLKILPKDFSYVFEFRHDTWYRDEIFELLDKRGIATCVADLKTKTSPLVSTGPTAYVRLHGPAKLPYRESYSEKAISLWAKRSKRWSKLGKDVYIYFDNTIGGAAARDALALSSSLSSQILVHSASSAQDLIRP
jgi:uncharacterized protein YecE (DUF72 family)